MTDNRKVYLKSIVCLGGNDPDFRSVLSPMEARRMGRLLKRAVWISKEALGQAGIEIPDAIITATDYGCIVNSVEFLKAALALDDTPMRPIHFMQSTHNTISSVIAVYLHCHGYNTTYSHRGSSLESALLDAWMQIRSGEIETALVGWFDEEEPLCAESLRSIGITLEDRAVSMVLSSDGNGAVREIAPPFNSSDYVF